MSGDYRFRNGYSKSNPRKMVKMWAEKEYRNLSRYSLYSLYWYKSANTDAAFLTTSMHGCCMQGPKQLLLKLLVLNLLALLVQKCRF
jgi:hypothetical protein